MKSVDRSLDYTRKHSLRAVHSRVEQYQYSKNYRPSVTNHKIKQIVANAVKCVATFSENRVFRRLENVFYGGAPTRVTRGNDKDNLRVGEIRGYLM